ncbi:MAG: DMT family transporter [Xanthobacteraceae bacterium]
MHLLVQRLFGRLYNAPYLLLVLTTLFWAGNINVGRYAAGYVPPVALGTLRWVGAALILLPFALPYLRADWPVIRKHAAMLTLLSLLSISAYNTLTYYGLQFTEAINAVILQSTGSLVVVAFAFLLFGERLGPWQLFGMILSFAGVAVVVSRGESAALLDFRLNIGDLILLAAIASYSLYTVLLRRRPPIHPLSFVTLTMGWGAILLLPFWAAEIAGGRTVPLEAASLAIVAYVIIFPSLLAHFFFFRGVEMIGANRAAPFMYLIPVFATALAILFLGEELHLFHAAGFMLVIGGVLIATRRQQLPAEVKT